MEELKEQVKKYLDSTNSNIAINDYMLEFTMKSTIQDILNFCNLTELPKELEYVVIRRVIGSTLEFHVRTNGTEDLNIDKMVRSITEGDVSITYDDKLDRNMITFRFIEESKNYGEYDLYSFRKMRW